MSAILKRTAFPPLTVRDLYDRFGPLPVWRVVTQPAPGTATDQDVLNLDDHADRLCELVDGTLIQKPMGYQESQVALYLGRVLDAYVEEHDLGLVTGEAGMMRLVAGGPVRIPDVSFVPWSRLPEKKAPRQPIPDIVPDLVVEVLSDSNTEKEMLVKLDEYFSAGVRLVWYVDPEGRTVEAFTAPDQSVVLAVGDTLEGGPVLPGFSVPVANVFKRLG